MSLSISLTINGVQRTVELEDPRVTLLDLLREQLELTGTKKGCNRNRRLAKDFEGSIPSANAFLYAACVMLLTRRLARSV